MRTQPRRPRATRAERASLRRSSCTGRSRSLARSPRPSSPRQVNREETVRLGQLHREREKATSQREEERGKKEERASPSTPPPPHLHRPHARPTRLELVDVELGGRVVRVPRARLGLARAGRRHLVKVVRRDRPGGARRARQARRRTDAPDEVGDEAAGERKREARQSQRRGPSGRGTGGTRRPTHPVQPVWCDAPRPLPFSQLKNSAREEGVRQ